MTKDEALKMAIEALEEIHVGNMTPMAEINWNKAIQACKEALALSEKQHTFPDKKQPAQEPVGWGKQILNEFPLFDDEGLDEEEHHCEWTLQQDRKRLHAMINSHPAPSWQGLSDGELSELLVSKGETSIKYLSFARAIEQALRNKNGY